MNTNRRHAVIALSLLAIAALVLYIPKFKTSRGTLKKAAPEMNAQAALPQQPIDRIEFLNAVFEDTRPPEWVGDILVADPAKTSADSLEKALKWSTETGTDPVTAWLQAALAEKKGGGENLTRASRTLMFAASASTDKPVVAAFLFQQGKRLVDVVLANDRNNAPALNALIVYQSEYENQPMKFLGTMRESLAIDSNNVETRFLRLNLLRKSQQWKKAVQECQKLISLQPQNPTWYFQASDIYGFMGDSTSARMFLDLAVKVQKNQKQ